MSWKWLLMLWSLAAAVDADDATPPDFGRIVGGTPVPFGTYGFHGLSPPGALCGCSLIHPDVALTAGHCQGLFEGLSIYLGGILPDRTDAVEVVEIIEERLHPQYNRYILDNDLLLLRLKKSSKIEPIQWNDVASEPTDGELLTAIGFGVTAYDGPRSDTLLQVDVPAMDRASCASEYASITDNMLCAGGEEGKDACTGDSGSPIMNENGVMVGVVSTGPSGGCGLEGKPGIYARTSTADTFFKQAICDWTTSTPPDYCNTFTPYPTRNPTPSPPTSDPPTYEPTVTPPFNDDCPTARLLGGDSFDGTSEGASPDAVALCGRDMDTSTSHPGVWFRLVGSGSIMSVDVCDLAGTQLFVFDGDCNNLHCVRGSNGGCDDSRPGALVEWASVFDREYWILLQTSSPALFTITTDRFRIGPTNVACFLPASQGLGTVEGSTLGGGPAPFSGECGVAEVNGLGVWYIVEGDGMLRAHTCSSPSEIDTRIVIFQGDCNGLQCVAGDNDGCGNPMSSVTWNAEPGTDYRIFVHGEVGEFMLTLEPADTVPMTTPGPTTLGLPTGPPTGPPTTDPTPEPEEERCGIFCLIWRFLVGLFTGS